MDIEGNESESWEMGVKQKMETPKRVKETISEIKHRIGGAKSLL